MTLTEALVDAAKRDWRVTFALWKPLHQPSVPPVLRISASKQVGQNRWCSEQQIDGAQAAGLQQSGEMEDWMVSAITEVTDDTRIHA